MRTSNAAKLVEDLVPIVADSRPKVDKHGTEVGGELGKPGAHENGCAGYVAHHVAKAEPDSGGVATGPSEEVSACGLTEPDGALRPET